METLWKVRQRKVLCDKKKFQVSIKEKENNWFKTLLKNKKMFKNDFSQLNTRRKVITVF